MEINKDLDRFAIKKLHVMIPAGVFDKICKAGKMKDIDEIVTRLLIKEFNDGDKNVGNSRKY